MCVTWTCLSMCEGGLKFVNQVFSKGAYLLKYLRSKSVLMEQMLLFSCSVKELRITVNQDVFFNLHTM